MQTDNPLWDFACKQYQSPGMAKHLLYLQDNYACNINILLALSWLGKRHILIDGAFLKSIIIKLSEIEVAIIQPMRTVRKGIKQYEAYHALYEQAKAFELLCEQYVIAQLYQQLAHLIPTNIEADAISQNIMLYFYQLSVPQHHQDTLMEMLDESL